MQNPVIIVCVIMAISGSVLSQAPIPEDTIDYDALFESTLNITTDRVAVTEGTTAATTPAATATSAQPALICPPVTHLCVPYRLCGDGKLKDGTLNLDDPTNPCHYLLTCCPLLDIHENRIDEPEPTDPVPTVPVPPTTVSSQRPPVPVSSSSSTSAGAASSSSTLPVILPTQPTNVKITKCGMRNKDGVTNKLSNNRDHEAEFGEFPWMVALLKEDELFGVKTYVYKCGGSLIHPKVVLTAAHCVNRKPTLIARAGEWDSQTDFETIPSQDRNITDIIVHESYYKGGLFNDIALLILDRPFDLVENVQPVCLAKKNSRFDSIECTASGWGAFHVGGAEQTILKKVDLPIVPRDRCQEQFRKLRKSDTYELHESYLCAGGQVGKDTCKGDGGSPLVCPVAPFQEQYVQTGIVSWGRGCGTDVVPGVYANIPVLRDWIDSKMQDHNLDTIYYEV